MAGRTIWKGNIHFGNEDLPVKLQTAVREERIQFHLLHKRDHARLRQQMVCAYDKKPVQSEDQVKGFELEDGKYLIVDPEELERADPEESRDIEVHEFVRNDQIDPIYFERVYYLEPDAHTGAFTALADVLNEMDLAGVCTWVMRKRSYFGALRASGTSLRLGVLRYADEVVPVRSLELEKIPLIEKELKIAADLIEHFTGSFKPERFRDEHQKKLQALIEKKARGEKIAVLKPRHLKPTQPDKLLQALEESLKKVA
jgi:DNA end-binding protein Ku